jgi:hypothetical protein
MGTAKVLADGHQGGRTDRKSMLGGGSGTQLKMLEPVEGFAG